MPWCGASRVGRSSRPDTLSLGRAARARPPLAVGAGDVGMKTRHQTHSARSCELALRAVGAEGGRLGGVPPVWVWDVRGWALFHARPSILGACGRGPLPTGCGRGGCGAWGPITDPTARALLSCLCPLWGRGLWGLGTNHRPHSARSSELLLPAVGAAQRRPGGGRL